MFFLLLCGLFNIFILYKMSLTLSLSSSYVSSATSPTNSFSDDVFVYVILTSTTVAVNSIISTASPEKLVNLVVAMDFLTYKLLNYMI
jgi:hypothetical protein